ncbi:MAG: hypothetical protein JO104_11550 [Candidatus Eremiobacteraeota bacterium]|nr:hypothetical protein [Candidatus Eremiobacteraeota bacterium]
MTDPKVGKLEILNPSYKIVRTITKGLSEPVGDFVDSSGNLYVANENNCSGGNVVEYALGAKSPSFTYSQGLVCPLYVGADSNGHVFVFDNGYGTLSMFLAEYNQDSNQQIATWTTCNTGYYAFCDGPTGLAIGPNNSLFLTLYGALHGSLNPFWVVDEILFNYKNEQLYVSGNNGPGGGTAVDNKLNLLVGAYPVSGSGGGLRNATGSGNWGIVRTPLHCGTECTFNNLKYKGFKFVSALALSANQKTLYVADYGGSTLYVLTYPQGKLVTALGAKNGLTDPDGVALGPKP